MRNLPAGAIMCPARCGRAPMLALTIVFVVAASAAVALPQNSQQQEEEVPSELRRTAIKMGAPGLVAPKMIERQLPRYTDEAVRQGIEGDAYIEAVVTVDGAVAEPVLIRSVGDDELDRRALDAIATWKFEPGTVDSEPVAVIALFTVTFRIGDEADEESEPDSRETAVQIGGPGIVAPRLIETKLPEYSSEEAAAAGGAQQNPTRMEVGTVSADWTWEPMEQPSAPNRIAPPEIVKKVVPGFPSASVARDGYQGHVIVEATIDRQGRVVRPTVVRTPADGIFEETVLTALGQWSFRPATRDGLPVEVTGIFTVRFWIAVSERATPGEQREEAGLRADAVQMGSGGLVAPRQLTTELPEYTAEAKDAGIEGDVYVEAVVTVEGNVVEPKLIRGLPDDELNRRALEAIIKWKFEPGTKDDVPVPVIVLFTVIFRIH